MGGLYSELLFIFIGAKGGEIFVYVFISLSVPQLWRTQCVFALPHAGELCSAGWVTCSVQSVLELEGAFFRYLAPNLSR